MRKHIQIQLSVLVVVACVSVALFLLLTHSARAPAIPDTSEMREVITTLEHAYQVLDTPFDELDLNQLGVVWMIHPDYAKQLSADELAELKSYTSKIQGEAAIKDLGYLTAIRTKRMNQQHGAKLLSAAREKAKAENREVTSGEMKQLTEQNYGLEPYLPEQGSQEQDPPFKRIFRYLTLKIDGDKAEIVFDDMVKDRKALLVRVDGHWYVAGIF